MGKDWKSYDVKGRNHRSKLKYITLFLVTAIIISSIFMYKKQTIKKITTVKLFEVTTQKIEETVNCSGRIEAIGSEEINTEYPYVVKDVLVNVGDYVEEGEVLFTVDSDATRETIAAVSGVSPGFISKSQIPADVKSTTSGVISTLNAVSGEVTGVSSPSVIISKNDDIQIKISIPESKLKATELGQEVKVSGPALKKDSYRGELTYIAPSARQNYNGATGETIIDALISLKEYDDSLKPGLSADTKIIVSENENCFIIPYDYVLQDDTNNEFVYLLKEGKAVKNIITTGREFPAGFEIVSGINAGDKVIKNPDDIKKTGEEVLVASS